MKFVAIILGISLMVTALLQGVDASQEQFYMVGIILMWMGILKDNTKTV